MIHGKTLEDWCTSHPLIRELVALGETAWFNPGIAPAATALADVGLRAEDVAEASAHLQRFAPSPYSRGIDSPRFVEGHQFVKLKSKLVTVPFSF